MLNQMLKISQKLPEGETFCGHLIEGAFWQDFHSSRIDWHQYSEECEPSGLSIRNREPFKWKVAIGNLMDFQGANLPVEVLLDIGEITPTCRYGRYKLTLRDSDSQEVLLEEAVFDFYWNLNLSEIASQVKERRVA